jgi:Ca2+-binding RTX toxin-like protein
MLIKAKTKIGIGFQYTPGNADDLLVQAGVVIRSNDSTAIKGEGAGQTITVAGAVFAAASAIWEKGAGADVVIQASGTVFSGGIGVSLSGANHTVENMGLIRADRGIALDTFASGQIQITNRGTIFTSGDSVHSDSAAVVLQNFGTIVSEAGYSFVGYAANDRVINRGDMRGSIFLEDGSDRYDGRGGTLQGTIYGNGGNDRFLPGAGAESIEGGTGIDTLDFRSGGAVTVNLLDMSQNRGLAKGDSYAGIDQIYGSDRGNDRLIGDADGSRLFGGAGRDTLTGGPDEFDVIVGGKGRDAINLPEGTSFYRDFVDYYAPDEGGDRINGFGVEDRIVVKASTFQGGLVAGPLSPGRFHAGANNHAADAGDRFIFHKGEATLWFDRDGTGGAFAPVLIADFTDGTDFRYYNIAVF